MVNICPEMITNAGTMPILSTPKVANLKSIVWNVHDPILLKMLVCREERLLPSDDCPYPNHIKKSATKKFCDTPKEKDIKYAQIYFRHEIIDKKARSCIVVFIKGFYLQNVDDLFVIYQNTVNKLKIADEKPYYHIIYFGDPIFFNDISKSNEILNKKIKEITNNEASCFINYADKNTGFLNITHTTIFTVKPTQPAT